MGPIYRHTIREISFVKKTHCHQMRRGTLSYKLFTYAAFLLLASATKHTFLCLRHKVLPSKLLLTIYIDNVWHMTREGITLI